MHAWGAADFRIYLTPTNHGYSISAQSYNFCPRLRKLDVLYFTLTFNKLNSKQIMMIFLGEYSLCFLALDIGGTAQPSEGHLDKYLRGIFGKYFSPVCRQVMEQYFCGDVGVRGFQP